MVSLGVTAAILHAAMRTCIVHFDWVCVHLPTCLRAEQERSHLELAIFFQADVALGQRRILVGRIAIETRHVREEHIHRLECLLVNRYG